MRSGKNSPIPTHDDGRDYLLLPWYFVRKRKNTFFETTSFAVRTPLWQLKQTRLCWHFNNRRRTVIQPISTTTSVESRNCPNPLQRQCPPLTQNQTNSNRSKTCTKRFWKSTEEDKKNYFHSLLRGDVLQTFKNITSPNRKKLGEILTVFNRKYAKTSVNGYGEAQISTTGFQSRKPKYNWFSGRTPEINKRCIRSCCSRDHRTIHLCHNGSPLEESN